MKKRYSDGSLDPRVKRFHNGIMEPFHRIEAIQAHIHKIAFSTTFSKNMIAERFGFKIPIHPIDKTNISSSKYLYKGHFNFKNLKMLILTGFNSPEFKFNNRLSQLTVVPDGIIKPNYHRSILLELNDLFRDGDVKINTVELGYDFFFKETFLVQLMFESLCKIIYIPYITDPEKIIFVGSQFKSGKKFNAVIKFGEKNKLYERGRDDHKTKYNDKEKLTVVKGWNQEGLDRVRFERTLDRRDIHKLKINTLLDLANHQNSGGINILHKLLNYPQFREVAIGESKANYTCLMDLVTRMKRKSNYAIPFKRLHARSLRNKMNKAICVHSKKWLKN